MVSRSGSSCLAVRLAPSTSPTHSQHVPHGTVAGTAVRLAEVLQVGSCAVGFDGVDSEQAHFGPDDAPELASPPADIGTAHVAVLVSAAGHLVPQTLRRTPASHGEPQVEQGVRDGCGKVIAVVPELLTDVMNSAGQGCSTGGCRDLRLAALTER